MNYCLIFWNSTGISVLWLFLFRLKLMLLFLSSSHPQILYLRFPHQFKVNYNHTKNSVYVFLYFSRVYYELLSIKLSKLYNCRKHVSNRIKYYLPITSLRITLTLTFLRGRIPKIQYHLHRRLKLLYSYVPSISLINIQSSPKIEF